jgi:hypothetical protein
MKSEPIPGRALTGLRSWLRGRRASPDGNVTGRPLASPLPAILFGGVALATVILLSVGILTEKNALIAAVASLAVLFIFLVRPMTFVLMFILLIPLVPKLPMIALQGYYVPVRFEDFFILLCLAIVLSRRSLYPSPPIPKLYVTWLLVFLFLSFASTAWGVAVLATVKLKTGGLFLLRIAEYFSVFLISLSEIRTLKQMRGLIIASALSTLGVNLYAILQEFSLVPVFNTMHMDDQIVSIYYTGGSFADTRLFSTFSGPYDLAAFYVILTPCFLLLAIQPRLSSWARTAYSVLFGSCMLCSYLTFSRISMAALAVSLMIALWLGNRRMLAVLIPPLSLIPVVLFSGFRERLEGIQTYGIREGSLSARLEYGWVKAWDAFTRSPVLGSGLGSFTNQGVGVDGFYLLLLGMVGVLGLLVFLIIQFQGLTICYRVFRSFADPTVRWFAGGLLAGSIGLAIDAIFIDIYFASKIAEVYWFFIGALFAAEKLIKAEIKKEPEKSLLRAGHMGLWPRTTGPGL